MDELIESAKCLAKSATHVTIHYITWPMITIKSRYGDSAMSDILQENHIMKHHDVCLTEEYIHTTHTLYT